MIAQVGNEEVLSMQKKIGMHKDCLMPKHLQVTFNGP